MLCTGANDHGQDWDIMLPNLLMAYRSSVHVQVHTLSDVIWKADKVAIGLDVWNSRDGRNNLPESICE